MLSFCTDELVSLGLTDDSTFDRLLLAKIDDSIVGELSLVLFSGSAYEGVPSGKTHDSIVAGLSVEMADDATCDWLTFVMT